MVAVRADLREIEPSILVSITVKPSTSMTCCFSAIWSEYGVADKASIRGFVSV